MDVLKRCSGNTFCSYANSFEKGFLSFLYIYGALPQRASELAFGRTYSTAINRVKHVKPIILGHGIQKRTASYSVPSIVDSDDAMTTSEKKNATPKLPTSIVKRLKSLQVDIISTILEQSDSTKSLVNFSSISATNFAKNLQEMAKYYFDQGGKLFRPTVSLLMSSACSQTTKPTCSEDEFIDLNQYRIAMVAEMIHTASLVHDDVIDESDTRRGQPTVNARWGNRQAVLVGDFILARATKVLCSIGDPPVISTMAEIVEDLVQGELMQLTAPNDLDPNQRFQHYMTKTFYKTGSLFANSCKSVAMIAGCKEEVQKEAFEYGRNLGLAFQLVDDMLDYVASSAMLGKPSLNDLKQGLATCPVLFAAKEYPELNVLITRRFKNDGDVEKALNIVMNSDGLLQTKKLAKKHCLMAAAVTGTGKSTFINSISNYFMFETLEEALKSNQPACVISSKFELTFKDTKGTQQSITVSMRGIDPNDESNEKFTTVGQSCTTQPRVYSFQYKEIEFNVIDVPGIADTGGISQDMINKRAIIHQIGRFTEIHGICIMVKENTSRLTTEFLFGINEILSSLSRSAINNIFFIVTHSSSSGFTPGQVATPLKSYIQELNKERKLDIKFDKNVFCIDNESFRFQIGWNKSPQFQEANKGKVGRYEESWKESRDSVFGLFKTMYLMNAHQTEDTLGVARASTIIQCIIGPLSTVMNLITQGSSKEHKEKVMNSLMGNGTLNKPDVEAEKLNIPQLNCVHKDCIKVSIDPKTNKKSFDFSNPCHKECLLKGVVKASTGDPGLKECQKFGLDDNCRTCGHHYTIHMHVPFKLTQTTSQVESGKTLNREEAERRYHAFYSNLNTEKASIMEGMIVFSTFLRENAIIEYNTAFEERLKVEIRKEELNENQDAVEKLREVIKNYNAKISIIDKAKNGKVASVGTEDITKTLKKLFTLPLYGKTIHNLFEKELPPSDAADARDFIRCVVRYIPDE
ncbi:hypothetical protein FO519_008989 [Halicephalobus sp. NKZ332]|nr:hypothetical protein FO519_008989 [Halicephalobus sp. NKZ332]